MADDYGACQDGAVTDSTTDAASAHQPSNPADLVIGIIGGTGDQGRGIATRLARAGVSIIIGSRDAARAQSVADELPGATRGADNLACAQECDVAIVAVPWEGHGATVAGLRDALAGKVVIDCVNPLGFDKQGAYALRVDEGSAAQQAAGLLPESRVTAAFHHVSAVLLLDDDVETVDTDVLVLGDDREATDLVQSIASLIPGMRGVYGGRLRNAGQVEALTANLISINRRYKAHAGVRVTDLPE